MHLQLEDNLFKLRGTPKELKNVKELPIGNVFPKKPRVIQNVVTRLGLNQQVELPPLKPFPRSFHFHTEPLNHQLRALQILWTFKGTNLLLDPGLGKTKILLDYIHLKGYSRTLVVCPSPLKEVWLAEADAHRPEVAITPVHTTTDPFRGNVLLLSYAMTRLRLEDLLVWRPELIILDEALIQNDSIVTQDLITLGKVSKERILASGSLVNNGPRNLYFPLKFSEPSLVGGSFIKFQDRFLVPMANVKYRYTEKPKNIEELRGIVQATSVVMRKSEVMKDLPTPITKLVNVSMPESYITQWEDIKSSKLLRIEGVGDFELDNPLAVYSRLSQLSAGFFYLEDKVPWYFKERPKVEAFLRHALQSRERGIVWFRYTAQGLQLKEALDGAGISYLFVDGKTRKVAEVVQRFNKSEVQFLIAQEKVLNYGQTIMGSEEGLFPGLSGHVVEQHFITESYSYQVSTQQEGRNHRIGLKFQPVYYKYLMTELDFMVRSTLESRHDVSEEILKQFVLNLKPGGCSK